MVMWKLTGHIWRLAARSTPSTIAPGRSESPLLLSARFSAQSELNDFFDFFRLAIADKNGHNPSSRGGTRYILGRGGAAQPLVP